MHKTRIEPQRVVTQRLDPDYYHPQYLKDEDLLIHFGSDSLAKAGKFFVGPFGSKLPSSLYLGEGIPLFRISNIGSMQVDMEGMAYLSPDVHSELSASEVLPGDLLIVKASVGEKISKVPENISCANITQHIIALRPNGSTDIDYIAVFLFCDYGRRQLVRRSLGSIIQYLGVNDTKTVLLPKVDAKVQTYIGDKVRQAERLRERITLLGLEIQHYFDQLLSKIPVQITKKKHSRVTSQKLTHRINAEFYSEKFTAIEVGLSEEFAETLTLGDIAPTIREKEKPKNRCIYREIGDIDIATGTFNEGTPYSARKAPNNAQRVLDAGDVAVSTRRPNRGAVAVVENGSKSNFYSVFLARLKPQNLHQAFWIKEYLRHEVGKRLLEQRCTWTTYPVISEDDLETIPIPYDPQGWEYIGSLSIKLTRLRELSLGLTNAAKLLVEALIEGKLSEADLKAAQEDLEQDDTGLDREILARLTRKGIDCFNEPPLFPDLDALYDALSDLEDAEASGDESTNGNGRTSNIYPLPNKSLPLASETGSGTYDSTEEVPR